MPGVKEAPQGGAVRTNIADSSRAAGRAWSPLAHQAPLESRREPSAQEWIDTIKRNPEKFPKLNRLIQIGEIHADPKRKRREFAIRITPLLAPSIAAGVIFIHLTRESNLLKGKIDRRKFLTTALAGAGLMAAGRTADVCSTRETLKSGFRFIEGINTSEVFLRLPSEVRRGIIPEINAIETNPIFAGSIHTIIEPKNAAKSIVMQTLGIATFGAIVGYLTKISVKITGRISLSLSKTHGEANAGEMHFNRRNFLFGGVFVATASFAAGVNNVIVAERWDERALPVIREMEELEKMMRNGRS